MGSEKREEVIASEESSHGSSEFGRLICAIGAGNALEWFDFAIYGALADIIGTHFFPSNEPQTALLASFTVYSSTFLMRPLGGIIMGYIGDNFGRKFALELSISLMVIPGFFMGCLPTFSSVGYVATILLVLLRMLQGLAVGGEMIGAYIFTIEACEPTQKGLWGGVCKATALCGTVLGMGFVTLLREILSEHDLQSWGWRIPFLASVLLGIVGLYLRFHLNESEAFVKVKNRGLTDVQKSNETIPPTESSKQMIKSSEDSIVKVTYAVFLFHWPEILLVMGIAAYWAAGYYATFIWMAYYTSDLMPGGGMEHHPWIINITMMIVLVTCLPVGGIIGDLMMARWSENLLGYRRTMAFACAITILFSTAAFYLINLKHVWSVCVGQGIFAISLCMYGSMMPVVMVEQFEVQHRYLALGIAVAYNFANALFGGPAPLIQTALVTGLQRDAHQSPVLQALFPALYIILMALISSTALLCGPTLIAQLRGGHGPPSSAGTSVRDLEMPQGYRGSDRTPYSLDSSRSPLVE